MTINDIIQKQIKHIDDVHPVNPSRATMDCIVRVVAACAIFDYESNRDEILKGLKCGEEQQGDMQEVCEGE